MRDVYPSFQQICRLLDALDSEGFKRVFHTGSGMVALHGDEKDVRQVAEANAAIRAALGSESWPWGDHSIEGVTRDNEP